MFMNRRGQALVEFILILPVFIMILFTIVDFGSLLYTKNELQNQSTDIILLINNGEEIGMIEHTYSKVRIQVDSFGEDYQKITLSKEINFITPFLDRILGSPYSVEVERIVPNA